MFGKRLIAALILVFSISLCFLISPALPQSPPVDFMTKAPVMLDGRILFQASGSGNFTANQRAQIINSILKQTAELEEVIQVKINRQNGQITIRVAPADDIDNDTHLVTVTETDLMLGMTAEDRAKIWQQRLQNAIDTAQKERTNAYIFRATVISLLLIAVAIALRFQFQSISRNLSRRGNQNIPSTQPNWQRFLPLILTGLQAVIWAAVVFYIAELFPLLRTWRHQFFRVLTASFTTPLFRLGTRDCSLLDVLLLLVLVIGLWILVKGVTRLLKSRVISQAITNRNLQDTVAFLTQYALSFIGLLIIFQGWGIDVSSLAILASALGVGIGFGLQNITNNFISGLIITFERPIQIGDFVKVGDTVGVVERIGLRSTEISTLDQVSLIVPNSRFLESEVLNWSHGNPVSRIRVPIGVAYGSNIPLLRKIILEVVKSHHDVLHHPGPQLWFQEFGDSSLNFDLFV